MRPCHTLLSLRMKVYITFYFAFCKIKVQLIICICSLYYLSVGLVSNLQRIRLRSNSTGTRPANRRGHKGPCRLGLQQETTEKSRSPFTCKVPKSASVSGLSLIVTAGMEMMYSCRLCPVMWYHHTDTKWNSCDCNKQVKQVILRKQWTVEWNRELIDEDLHKNKN